MRSLIRLDTTFLFALLLASAGTGLRAASMVTEPPHTATTAVEAAFAAEESGRPSHEDLYKWVNFGILVVALGYLLRKPLSSFFADRVGSIRKELEEGRRALEASEARLAAVEEKLRDFEHELAGFRVASEREMEAERERLKQSAEKEAERILEFAKSQIEAAERVARLDLKRYASGQALELAEALIRQRLDEAARHRLVNRFVGGLAEKPSTKN